MATHQGRTAGEGLGFGIIAGVIFGIMEIVGAALMGNPPLMPLRMFASIVLGNAALETTSLATAVVVGSVVHLALSAAFGLVYAAVNGRLGRDVQTSWGSQVLIGLGFGVALWIVNFHIIARLIYPWFLMTPQFLQMMMHAVFFGLPLALMYAAAERRAPATRPAAEQRV